MFKRHKKLKGQTITLAFILGFIWLLFLYNTPSVLNILSLKYVRPLSTSFMRYKSFSSPLKRARYKWVSYNNISNYLKDAVIVAEDDRFFKHNGLDLKAIKKAARTNWKRRRFDRGASTIPQQLAKNLYLSPSKDPIRKLREAILAIFLDSYLSKERILELYLNVVEWGPGVFGAEAAAGYYFGTTARNLTPAQSAFLASILPNPVRRGRGGFHLSNRAISILNRIR